MDDLRPKQDEAQLDTAVPQEEHAYIRHIEKTQEELEDQVEYDLDSDDEEWLENRTTKVSTFAACLLVNFRFDGSHVNFHRISLVAKMPAGWK